MKPRLHIDSPDDSNVTRYFDRLANDWSERYDRSYFFRIRRERFRQVIRRYVSAAQSALDFGCGSGPLTPLLADVSKQVNAVDRAPQMVEVARQRLRGMSNVVVGTAGALPDESYDVILCSSVIEYVADDTGLVLQFARTLRTGGILLITFPNKFGLLQSIPWMFGRRSEYLQHRVHTYDVRAARCMLQPYFDVLEARTSIGLPLLRGLGLGELILAVARKRAASLHCDV